MHAVGVTADIKKAFLQISIAVKDRRYLRFLWWTDEGAIIVYRHCRVVFGLTCSPFLLAATLTYHLERYAFSEYAKSAELLKNSYYVDNCVASLSGQREAEKFISEAKQLSLEGKFELRGWVTAPIQCEGTEKQTTLSVLGMIWDTEKDVLRCNITSVKNCKNPITKRELLSVCNRVFDPIGVTSPTTLIPKLLLQKTWSLNIGWDVELPNELCREFKKWLEGIHWLNDCYIPRTLTVKSIGETQNSLHVFSDASKDAYATCIFLRSESCDGVYIQLVLAKARVTPVKEITIPRLELIAALMTTRLYSQVSDALRLKNCKAYFWSDSSVVVTWIVTKKEWSVFVRNRVREITETTRREEWRHINGSLNPADLPSRGCSAKKLVESRWWEGPSWLKHSEDKWPASLEIPVKEEEVNEELKPLKTAMTIADTIVVNFTESFKNISIYTRVVRTFSWMLRFIVLCRSKGRKTSGALSLEELNKAENKLLQIIQRESFTGKDKLRGMKSLETRTGIDDLLRVKTRLTLSDETEDYKLPILLSAKHPLVVRLVEEEHRHALHAGLNILTSILRNKFWILGGRKLARNVISKCVICKRHKTKSYKTASAPLPKNRVKATAVFQVTGVDVARPLILNTGEKCWILLFTCAVYRAIHLELLMSMSTESFLMALRRFIARRGRVQTIYSDNGTNFVGAENLLASVNWDDVKQYSDVHKIKWIFNPPAAPWWGGWWERLVQSVKQLLRRNLGNAVLNFVELETLICDIESIINKRPLTYITEDDTLRPLTPASFLQGLPQTEVSDLDQVDATGLRIRQQYLQKLREDLRQRFRNEYLFLLVSRSQKENRGIKVGDVVLIETESKRANWPLGLVIEVFTGKDGNSRVANVRTKDGVRTRPVQRLYPLEVQDEDIQEELDEHPREVIEDSEGVAEDQKRTRSGRVVKMPSRLDL